MKLTNSSRPPGALLHRVASEGPQEVLLVRLSASVGRQPAVLAQNRQYCVQIGSPVSIHEKRRQYLVLVFIYKQVFDFCYLLVVLC